VDSPAERGEARADAREKLIRTGDSGRAFRKIVSAQGGGRRVIDDPGLSAGESGRDLQRDAARIHCRRGATRDRQGRSSTWVAADEMEDPVDPSVGLVITAKPGDWVEAG